MGLRIKGLIILALLALCVFMILPTFQAYRPGADPNAIKNKVNLGLDLQGGMYIDLEVDKSAAVTRLLDRLAVEIEDTLLDKLVDYTAVERAAGSVEVILPTSEKVDWSSDPYDRLLRGYDLVESPTTPNRFTISLPPEEVQRIEENAVLQALEVIRNRIDSLGVSEPSIQRKGATDLIVQLPGLKNREQAISTIGTQAVLEFYMVQDNVTQSTMDPARHQVKYEEERDPTTKKIINRIPYIMEKRPVLSGETVRDARVQISNQDNTPYVGISFDSIGADRFASVTGRNKGRRLAIVLDDKVHSAPVIREAITGGEAQISGRFTMEEARELAIVLRSGSLPAPLEIREERTVGASLGEDSVRQGIMALLIGGVIVMVFMILYYRVSGAFACFALVFNLLIIMVVLAGFQATLTLPGIAGIVLTMGMSVDANVLIFERIREELKTARSIRAGITDGFNRAFWTIFDANVTTLVAALALMIAGTGPIKGFAVTLSIGILASMFTAIFVTRFMFELVYLRRSRLAEVSI